MCQFALLYNQNSRVKYSMPTSIFYMTLNNLMVSLPFWSFGEYLVPLITIAHRLTLAWSDTK